MEAVDSAPWTGMSLIEKYQGQLSGLGVVHHNVTLRKEWKVACGSVRIRHQDREIKGHIFMVIIKQEAFNKVAASLKTC